MQLNIDNNLYTINHLDLVRTNIIFGNNGTGKSTLTRMIQAQCSQDYDVRVFQGFQSIVGTDERLNAVVLGEENAAIQAQIVEAKALIQTYELAKEEKVAKISLPAVPDPENLVIKQQYARNKLDSKLIELDKFYSAAAKRIKSISSPAIAVPTYNKKNFIADIKQAAAVSETERQQYLNILRSEVKTAPAISFPLFNMDTIISRMNALLAKKVEEKFIVARLENNPEKQRFAQEGLRIHKPGDVCAFCGSLIPQSAFDELRSYFSADETKALQAEIRRATNELSVLRESIMSVRIESSGFYADYADKVNELAARFAESKIEYINIIDRLTKELQNKASYLFESLPLVEITEKPYDIRDFSASYALLRKQNNEADLVAKQRAAKDALRLDAVKKELDEFHLEDALYEQKMLQHNYDEATKAIEAVEIEINEIKGKIKLQQDKISRLLAQTKNEQKLAKNVNEKLKTLASFQLEHYEDYDHKGYYRVKDPRTGDSRPITQLSTGEKNIIAFLYFLQKLDEVKDGSPNLPKMIVFDDPMNSNDEDMRLVIINELRKLVHRIETQNKDSIVILTHNIDCYLELCRNYHDNDYSARNVIHLVKSNYQTTPKKITCRQDDFNSKYTKAWLDLIYLYNDPNASSDLMLNPMRRIIEQYTSFNRINWNTFCNKAGVPLGLFHEGSHAATDLESPAENFSKYDLLKIFWQCFVANRCDYHFKRYWPGVETLLG